MDNKDIILAKQIASELNELGGTVYYVGGYVRDRILGNPIKDIDIELHNIAPYIAEDILSQFGEVEKRMVNGTVAVLNIKGYDLDIAYPRTEIAIGKGHKDFNVKIDPYLPLELSAKRRDFTINALMENVLTGEIKDFYGGIDDLNNKIIRHVNDNTFIEDPLRVLRACQFAARFNFAIAPETMELCKTMDLSALSKERVAGELTKALLKSDKPSVFFNKLYESGHTSWFKEVYDLKGIRQNEDYHPEKDAYDHTMYTIDEAADFRYMLENKTHTLPFMLSALCHDLGKANTTTINDNGKIQSIGHENTGIILAKQLLDRIYNNKTYTKYVCNMVELHMKPHMCFKDKAKTKTTNLMFDKSVAPEDLIYLVWCDSNGRDVEKLSFKELDKLLNRAFKENSYLIDRLLEYKDRIKQPFVTADDLLNLGLEPSPLYKTILDKAWNMHLKGVDKPNVLKQIVNELTGDDKKILSEALKKAESDKDIKTDNNSLDEQEDVSLD